MIVSLIKKYILPKEVDFIAALNQHVLIITKITDDLYECFINGKNSSCDSILNDVNHEKQMREKNMKELLGTFITPIDRESIYRVTTQLDWIALSITHFTLEAKAYEISKLDYSNIIKGLQYQSQLLSSGFKTIKSSPLNTTQSSQKVRNVYNEIVEIYVKRMAMLAKSKNMNEIFIQKELLNQLKEISKRMQMCANSLEDIVMKMS